MLINSTPLPVFTTSPEQVLCLCVYRLNLFYTIPTTVYKCPTTPTDPHTLPSSRDSSVSVSPVSFGSSSGRRVRPLVTFLSRRVDVYGVPPGQLSPDFTLVGHWSKNKTKDYPGFTDVVANRVSPLIIYKYITYTLHR